MNEHAKGRSMVLGPEDGEALWQPLPSTGYVINKLNPYNSPYDAFATGIQVLEPGTHVRRHAHERSHEVLFCYRGSGYVEIEAERHELTEETMVLVGRGLHHKIVNTGPGQLRMLWMISPPGLEDWFRAIGRPRRPGEPVPPPFPRPDNVDTILAQQRFVPRVAD